MLDRFRQIAPKVLVAVDGQVWGGVAHDRRPVLHEVLAGLPSVEHLVFLADVDPAAQPSDFAAPGRQTHAFADWTAGDPGAYGQDWQAEWLPFDHPLWVVYSSGTTGLPKALVHGHGGVMLELLKGGALHNDIAPSYPAGAEPAERFHWFRQHRLDHVERPGRRAAGAAPRSAFTTATPVARCLPRARRPTGARCGASPPQRRSPGSVPVRPSTPAA